MDTALDKQKEIDDKYRNDFVQKIQGNIEPKRGKNVIIRKTKKRELSADELAEKFSPPVPSVEQPVLTGRLNEKLIDDRNKQIEIKGKEVEVGSAKKCTPKFRISKWNVC